MLYTIILSVITIICVLLTIVILLQPGQGQGISGGIAGGMAGGGGLGARRTADLLSKSTSVLGGALLVLCLFANFAIDDGQTTESAVQQSGTEQPAQSDLNNPSQTPSAVPELPQNQGSGNDGGSSDNGNGGSGSDGGN